MYFSFILYIIIIFIIFNSLSMTLEAFHGIMTQTNLNFANALLAVREGYRDITQLLVWHTTSYGVNLSIYRKCISKTLFYTFQMSTC